LARLAVGAVVLVDRAPVLQGEERLNLADHLAAGTTGIEDLVDKAKEGAAHAEDALRGCWRARRWGPASRGQQWTQEQFQVAEALLPEDLDLAAQVGQALAKGGKKRVCMDKYLYLSRLDVQLKCPA
jgi:hypothetical protein